LSPSKTFEVVRPRGKRWFSQSRLGPSIADHQLLSYVQRNAGVSVSRIATHFKVLRRELRHQLRRMAKRKLVTIDAHFKVFALSRDNAKTDTGRIEAAAKKGIQQRQPITDRIVENRLAWTRSVDRAWSSLRENSQLWIEDREKHLQMIAREIANSAKHYLTSSEVPIAVKDRARQVLDVANTAAMARKCGTLDSWVFAPFKWPSTEIVALASALHQTTEKDITGELLAHVGYKVGIDGKSEAERRHCLAFIMSETDLPGIELLPPQSCGRLRRVAYAIAYLVRQAKRRRNADMSLAISDWEKDLAWLKTNYYLGRCDRGSIDWPTF
jgi:hypothetical protein